MLLTCLKVKGGPLTRFPLAMPTDLLLDMARAVAPGVAGEPTVSLSALNHARTNASLQAFVPPSTVRFAPVIYEDSGPATNATKAATSSTFP
jgi:hypothetical protein